ncbi:NAD(P)H-binding protein [Streptomyces albidoflavus]|uniref:NAD(P)-dependent oxidoreductase n=1 Tax=Streptomyces albidoflavus TaxID=1886 RepID=UPI0033C85B97
MKIVVFGATGMIGSRITAEAVHRGHQVLAVSRSGAAPVPGAVVTAGDAGDPERVRELAAGADAVISAVAPPRDGSDPGEVFLAVNVALAEGVSAAAATTPGPATGPGAGRLVVVGGAASLEVAPDRPLVEEEGFPEAYRPEALAQQDVLWFYRDIDDPGLDWTYISPAPEIGPGERTGHYRIGGDTLLTAEGTGGSHASRISAEDFAVAVVDEAEQHRHPRTRISVAY